MLGIKLCHLQEQTLLTSEPALQALKQLRVLFFFFKILHLFLIKVIPEGRTEVKTL